MATPPATDRATALNLRQTSLKPAQSSITQLACLMAAYGARRRTITTSQPISACTAADIQAVFNDVNAALANPNGITVGGAAFTPTAQDTAVLTQVQGQLQTLLDKAPLSIGHGQAAANAQAMLHTTQTSILSEIANDPALATALGNASYQSAAGTTDTGFQALPTGPTLRQRLGPPLLPGQPLRRLGPSSMPPRTWPWVD